MKKLPLLSLLVAVLVVCAATAAQAAKIEICHRPAGNPDNWHTISAAVEVDKPLPNFPLRYRGAGRFRHAEIPSFQLVARSLVSG